MDDLRAPNRLVVPPVLQGVWYRLVALVLGDIVALAIAWKVAAYLNRFYSPMPPQLNWFTWLGLPSLFWLFASVTLILFAIDGLYQSHSQWKNYLKAGKTVSVVYLLSLVVSYFYDPKLDVPRSLFFSAWIGSVVCVMGVRLIIALGVKPLERRHAKVPVYLVAPSHRLRSLARAVKRHAYYQVVGATLSSTASSPVMMQSIIASQAREVLAEDLPESELASQLYWKLRRAGITLRLVPSSLEMLHRRGVPEIVAGLPTIRLEAPFLGGWDYRIKRLMDYLCAAFGLLGLLPLLGAIALMIRVTDSGPIFFRQERMGLHGQVFRIWKFRTMVVNADALQPDLEAMNDGDGILFKLKQDPRVTSIGRWLRRTSLDELPQLINVLLGQMSLVGPRPLPLRDIERFDPWHHARHQVLPGITGLWQIAGRSQIDQFNDAARLDLYYIDNWSLNLDLEILLETAKTVVFGKGAY